MNRSDEITAISEYSDPIDRSPASSRSPRRQALGDSRELGAIFAGGAMGALARVWLGLHLVQADGAWPWTIFAINVSGSFALAYFATRLAERLPQSTYRRPLLGTGLCGAYTTFSTVQVEVVAMIEHNRYGLAAGYLAASVGAGLLAIWLATTLVRRARVL